MSDDSYLQGQAVVRFDKDSTVSRADFFSRFDRRLMDSDAPSFSVFLFHDGGRAYIFESLHRTLYIAKGRQAIPMSA